MSTVYFTVGNSDDKLTQGGWSALLGDVRAAVMLVTMAGAVVHFAGHSAPDAPWQNALWCVEIPHAGDVAALKTRLAELARRYGQDSIAWAVVDQVELVPAASGVPR